MKLPSAQVLQLLLRRMATRRQHFLMPDSGYCGNKSLRESPAPGLSVAVEYARRSTQGLCLLTSAPLALTPPPDGSQVLQNLSAEGALVRRWGDPKEGGWRREAQHQETRSPRGPSKLLQPRCSTILWVHEAWFPGRKACGHLESVVPCREDQALRAKGARLPAHPPTPSAPGQSSLGTQDLSGSRAVTAASVTKASVK